MHSSSETHRQGYLQAMNGIANNTPVGTNYPLTMRLTLHTYLDECEDFGD